MAFSEQASQDNLAIVKSVMTAMLLNMDITPLRVFNRGLYT